MLVSVGAFAACQGPGAPTTTETRCVTAVAIPGNPLVSFDISWVNPDRGEFYLGDRSNSGIDIIDTRHNTFKRTIGGFVGAKINPATNKVISSTSGPDGVVSHGKWLYGGDGDSTLKVIDLDAAGTPSDPSIKQSISTGGTTRVDEMALTTDGKLLLAANNAEDPPFGTLFRANGDNNSSAVAIITKVKVDPSIIPPGQGLSIEQPTWDPKTNRFYVSVPQIKVGSCTLGAGGTCPGGLLVIDPKTLSAPTAVIGAFDPSTNTGVLALNQCGPNGAVVGLHDNLLLGCTPANIASTNSTLVINAKTKHFANIGGVTGSDEVWFNAGDGRYYTGSSANPASLGGPALGVISAETNLLVETIPQGSGSHSVAADSKRNTIYVGQVVPVVPTLPPPPGTPPGAAGGDTTGVSAPLCGTSNGCVVVYEHDVDEQVADRDHDHQGQDE
jgi:hypothetical protein